jgi:hypothetical protein
MNPFQQGSFELAGVFPTRRAVRVPFDERSPVLPASFKLIRQSGSILPSRHCLLLRRNLSRNLQEIQYSLSATLGPELHLWDIASLPKRIPNTASNSSFGPTISFLGVDRRGGTDSAAADVQGLELVESARTPGDPGTWAAIAGRELRVARQAPDCLEQQGESRAGARLPEARHPGRPARRTGEDWRYLCN